MNQLIVSALCIQHVRSCMLICVNLTDTVTCGSSSENECLCYKMRSKNAGESLSVVDIEKRGTPSVCMTTCKKMFLMPHCQLHVDMHVCVLPEHLVQFAGGHAAAIIGEG